MMDGKTVRNMYSIVSKQNKFEKFVHLVGHILESYHTARSYESQIKLNWFSIISKETRKTVTFVQLKELT